MQITGRDECKVIADKVAAVTSSLMSDRFDEVVGGRFDAMYDGEIEPVRGGVAAGFGGIMMGLGAVPDNGRT